jgi:hypothetical protein
MLTNAAFLKGLAIHATDGELGAVDEFLFDDDTWAVRYLVVKTGGWLDDRRVLISPMSVFQADWPAKRLDVTLTKEQVKHSPDIDTHQPVSRQHEADYLGYYGYPYYWSGPYYWGPSDFPAGMSLEASIRTEAAGDRVRKESADSHLRSSHAVKGYRVESTDGAIGHIDGFIVDDKSWAIRYLAVATNNWLPGKKVLIAPAWAQNISWEDSRVYVGVTKEAIKSAPEYLESQPLTREYEGQIYVHYGHAPYWSRESEHAALFASGRA